MTTSPARAVLAVSLVAGTFATPADVRAQPHAFETISWWQGCWERTSSGGRRRVERWSAPSGGAMKGGSRSFADSTETAGERLRVTLADGRLVYHAHPSNQPPQSFTATAVAPEEVTFENLAHDFPQRIIYSRRGTDSLLARIEGDRTGRQQPITFAFRRIGCEGEGESPTDVAEEALRPLYADLVTRLKAHPNATPGWFVAHASPAFGYLNFAAPGYMARAGSLRTQEAAARTVAGAAAPVMVEYSVDVTISAVHARGDTVEVLAVTRQSARTGPAGQQRPRASEQRRLDRWVRRGAEWKLERATVVDDEQYIDGKLSAKNGVPVPPAA